MKYAFFDREKSCIVNKQERKVFQPTTLGIDMLDMQVRVSLREYEALFASLKGLELMVHSDGKQFSHLIFNDGVDGSLTLCGWRGRATPGGDDLEKECIIYLKGNPSKLFLGHNIASFSDLPSLVQAGWLEARHLICKKLNNVNWDFPKSVYRALRNDDVEIRRLDIASYTKKLPAYDEDLASNFFNMTQMTLVSFDEKSQRENRFPLKPALTNQYNLGSQLGFRFTHFGKASSCFQKYHLREKKGGKQAAITSLWRLKTYDKVLEVEKNGRVPESVRTAIAHYNIEGRLRVELSMHSVVEITRGMYTLIGLDYPKLSRRNITLRELKETCSKYFANDFGRWQATALQAAIQDTGLNAIGHTADLSEALSSSAPKGVKAWVKSHDVPMTDKLRREILSVGLNPSITFAFQKQLNRHAKRLEKALGDNFHKLQELADCFTLEKYLPNADVVKKEKKVPPLTPLSDVMKQVHGVTVIGLPRRKSTVRPKSKAAPESVEKVEIAPAAFDFDINGTLVHQATGEIATEQEAKMYFALKGRVLDSLAASNYQFNQGELVDTSSGGKTRAKCTPPVLEDDDEPLVLPRKKAMASPREGTIASRLEVRARESKVLARILNRRPLSEAVPYPESSKATQVLTR